VGIFVGQVNQCSHHFYGFFPFQKNRVMYYNIAKSKPLKIFEFAVPQIQKSNLD
jgi:hypothetical protein